MRILPPCSVEKGRGRKGRESGGMGKDREWKLKEMEGKGRGAKEWMEKGKGRNGKGIGGWEMAGKGWDGKRKEKERHCRKPRFLPNFSTLWAPVPTPLDQSRSPLACLSRPTVYTVSPSWGEKAQILVFFQLSSAVAQPSVVERKLNAVTHLQTFPYRTISTPSWRSQTLSFKSMIDKQKIF